MTIVSFSINETAQVRFAQLELHLGASRNEALGILAQFWGHTRADKIERGSRVQLQRYLTVAADRVGQTFDALVSTGYVATQPEAEGVFHIVDNSGIAARHAKRRADGTAAAKKMGQTTRRRKKPSTALAPVTKAQDVATQDDHTQLQLACACTWAAYVDAYVAKIGQHPTRNAKTNALIKQFVQRLGHEEAPKVMTYFVSHPNTFYMQRVYMLDLALRDAEALRTQWAKNVYVTPGELETYERSRQFDAQRQRIEAGLV